MGSSLISICLKTPLKPLFHRAYPAFLLLPQTARFLCTRDSNPKLGGRQAHRKNSRPTNGQAGQRTQDWWDGVVEGRGKSFTPRMRTSIPKSVFTAGTAKRTAEMLKRKAGVASENDEHHEEEPPKTGIRGGGKVQPPDRPLSADEWRNLKEGLGNSPSFGSRMMSALLCSDAGLDIAKSLLTFVATETGTVSYELLVRYLTLCVNGGHDTEMFDVYDIMRASFPSLETSASSLFIKAFSRTERWREAISILNDLKKVITPSARNYSDIITAAMLNGKTAIAWALYDELMNKGLSPHQETWESLFLRVCTSPEGEGEDAMSPAEHQDRLLGILQHMRNNQVYPQLGVARSIKTWFKSLPGHKWTGSWTSATAQGVCRCCGRELESIQLTAEEYHQLRERVMTDVIKGQDIFNKTTPEELERFKVFVKRRPTFDVVVDGLNVANFYKDKNKLSEMLLAVVSELKQQGLTVLVLGRKHMLRPSRSWERHNMNLIQQKAHCFFTENISEDDPFLLYATLHSGNHCRFVSRDLMRDHKACLPDEATRRLFFKWQRGHQQVVDGYGAADGRVRFQSIPSYDTIVQTSGDSWHIPYDDTEDRGTCEVPQRWLCLTKVH